MSWAVADQAMSSLNSFLVGIPAAHQCGAAGFGVFSTAWVTYGVALAMSRGLSTDPLTVRYSGVAQAPWRRATSAALATALAVGVGVGGLCAVAGLALGGLLGHAMLALGVVLPGVLVQDAWRISFIAVGAGKKAFVNDLISCVVVVPLLFPAGRAGSPSAFLLAWGIAALVAATAGIVQAAFCPRPAAVRGWLGAHRELNARYLPENVTQAGSVQLLSYGRSAVMGFGALGSVRGANLLFGPLTVWLTGLTLFGIAEAVRTVATRPQRVRRFCVSFAAGKIVLVVGWGLFLLLLPTAAGRAVLGPLWASTRPLILPTTLIFVVNQPAAAARVGLRALGAARRSLRAQLVTSALTLIFGVVGAALSGVQGTVWGVVVATAIASIFWWRDLEAEIRVATAAPPGVNVTHDVEPVSCR
jgi:O-antigen/teichoic acid export membrane protein